MTIPTNDGEANNQQKNDHFQTSDKPVLVLGQAPDREDIIAKKKPKYKMIKFIAKGRGRVKR